jgi:hypothetical protein
MRKKTRIKARFKLITNVQMGLLIANNLLKLRNNIKNKDKSEK